MLRTKNEVIELAKKYGLVVSKLFDDVEVRLYGSYHSGKQHKDSDIDLAIISPEFVDIDYILTLKLLGRLKLDVALEIEAIGLTPEEILHPQVGSIGSYISKDSELVYQAIKLGSI